MPTLRTILRRARQPREFVKSVIRVLLRWGQKAVADPPPPVNLAYRHALALQERVPELRAFNLTVTRQNAEAVLDFYNAWLPAIRAESRGSYLRSVLERLRRAAPDLAPAATRAIAKSDLHDGLPDRAQILDGDGDDGAELKRQTAAMEQAYGAALITQQWPGADRGACLVYYLDAHRDLVAGKRLLHVAPEPSARPWLQSVSQYSSVDGATSRQTDIIADITDLPYADESYDVILCHRVLEHVLDDAGALRQFFRILRPGGLLNLSVPQAIHRDTTLEWLYPDSSHHGHVRQYGRDLTARIEGAGFTVEPVTWLIERSREELLAHNAYPMRMYNCRRPMAAK